MAAAHEEETIFATPDNTRFLSLRRYQELDPSRQQIRLLKIHPKRLKIDEIPTVFPGWASQLKWLLPLVSDPKQIRQPSHEVPLSKLGRSSFVMRSIGPPYIAFKVSRDQPPPGFDYRLKKESSAFRPLPCGWTAMVDYSPYRFQSIDLGGDTYENSTLVN
jgi:hypothetical protein